MNSIIPKALIPVVAIIMVGLILSQPVAHAVAPLVAVGAVVLAGVIGGIVGYWIGQSNAKVEQWRSDNDYYTKYAITIYQNGWYNVWHQINDSHTLFFNNTNQYYIRWGESIASSVCSENKSEITDADLKPVLKDLATILHNYYSRALDAVYDLYKKGITYAGIRKGAGLDDIMVIGWGISGYSGDTEIHSDVWVHSDGIIQYPNSGGIKPYKISLFVGNEEVGRIFVNGTKEIDDDKIEEIITGNSTIVDVHIKFVDENGNSIDYAGFGYYNYDDMNYYRYEDLEIPHLLKQYTLDVRLLYAIVKTNANNYCQMIALTGGQQIPPPSVALPYDLDTLSRLDPMSRMLLYQSYLYYLSQVDWNKINQLTADKINGLPDKTVKICGDVDVDGDGVADYSGCFMPMNIPWYMNFVTNGTAGIAGYWYWWNGQKIRIIKIMYREPPENYTIVKNISEYEVLITYGNGTKGILIDVDRDGIFDYLVPYIVVNKIFDVRYDPDSGQYLEYDANETSVGPKNAKEWTDMRLKETGGLPGSGLSLDGLKQWWSSLDWKTKIAIVAGGAIFLLVLLRAISGTKVTVVR